MPQTAAQKRAKKKYMKAKVKQICLEFYPTDKDILERLASVPAKATYIKQLIRADLVGNTDKKQPKE